MGVIGHLIGISIATSPQLHPAHAGPGIAIRFCPDPVEKEHFGPVALLRGPMVYLQGWNRLDAADMRMLADALRFNQSVISIELQHNALGADGGAALGEVLYDNRCASEVHRRAAPRVLR